jgi:hypothetical protein
MSDHIEKKKRKQYNHKRSSNQKSSRRMIKEIRNVRKG